MHDAIFPLLLAGALLACSPARAGQRTARRPAELVLRSATVITMDDQRPRARALALGGGRILAVGSNREMQKFIDGSTRVVDLNGQAVLPGFIDAHGHFLGLGRSLMQLELGECRSFDQVVERVAAAAGQARPGEWILGRGWHQERWQKQPATLAEGMPLHHELTRASPANPVYLRHASGHAALVNQAALQDAGITASSRDPAGGHIIRDNSGHPSGCLLEAAMEPVEAAYQKWWHALAAAEREARLRRAVDLASRTCLRQGVTTFSDAGSSFEEIDFLRRLARAGQLRLRLWVMIGEDDAAIESNIANYRIAGEGHGRLWVRAIKRYADGALGSHGALLLEPYSDRPDTVGLALTSAAKLERSARLARQLGLQLCTHAIGDGANRMVLDVYQKVLADLPDPARLRWRIEHAQHLHPDDIGRFAELGIIASMQSYHCVSDGPWVERRIGRQRAAAGAYAWQSLLASGAHLAWGTDTPVEAEDPLAGLYAFVTRRLADGSRFHPRQCISRLQALRAMTIEAAHADGLERQLGSLTPGKRADLVVLSADPLSVPEADIPRLRVLATLVDGRPVWRTGKISW